MSYIGQNLNVANSTPRASETQVGLTPYATTVETFFGVEAGKAVTPVGVMAALNLYGVTQADQRQATAWVNFNGTGTVAIRGAYNVSSITDNGAGHYSVNFLTPMTNENYCICLGPGGIPTTGLPFALANMNASGQIVAPTVNNFRLYCGVNGQAGVDPTYVYCQVFGGRT